MLEQVVGFSRTNLFTSPIVATFEDHNIMSKVRNPDTALAGRVLTHDASPQLPRAHG